MSAETRGGDDTGLPPEGATLGTLLRAWRERALLTQEQLARKTGLNVRTIRRLESDALRRPRSASVQLLAEALGLEGAERAAMVAAAGGASTTPATGDRAAPRQDPGVPGWPPTPRQLPADVVAFVGRARELSLIERVHGATAGTVLVIDGMAGIGKTALAVHAAHRMAGHFPDGHLYVDLRGHDSGRSMAPADALGYLLRSLGVPAEWVPADEQEQAAAYRSLLADKRMVVVLDNARDVPQVEPLLPGSPGCLTIITSRATLAALDGATRLHLDVLSEPEALAMLAHLAGPDRVEAQPEAAATVVRLCAMLPLAIRLAGARLAARSAWPIATLVERLADRTRRLDELRAGERAVRASFAVSYHALETSKDPVDREAARAFRLLGALEWAEMSVPVAASLLEVPQLRAREMLERLVDDRLLDLAAPGRYHTHDLLRLYARELADDEPEARRRAVRRRALECYVAAAEKVNLLLNPLTHHTPADAVGSPHGEFPLSTPADATAWIDSERDNLLAIARQAAVDPGAAPALVVRLTAALNRPYDLRGHWQDIITMRQLAARTARRLHDHRGEAFALQDLGWTHVRVGHAAEKALRTARRALKIWREIGDRRSEQACLNILGFAHRQLEQYTKAVECLEQALAICRDIGHRYGEATTLDHLGLVYQRLGRFEDAIACHRDSLAITRELGQRYGEATALGNLGWAHHRTGDSAQAVPLYQQSAAIAREAGDRYQEAESLWGLGEAHHDLGHRDQARRHWDRSAAILVEIGALTENAARALLDWPVPPTPEIIRRNT
ncbi:ATP-binding protein [Thermoactinospora rubra]|uniref:ATP-binding protein n=1 Tax=Thermoactinospora rubra TaxID=1088767 RepID=UPI000A11BB7F|nr:helix-turn-helix domain-containing protein [Thermoactinospora rubra]